MKKKTFIIIMVTKTIVCFKDQKYNYLDDKVIHDILVSKSFGFSKLRLQHKKNYIRMVANLKGSSRMSLFIMRFQNSKR